MTITCHNVLATVLANAHRLLSAADVASLSGIPLGTLRRVIPELVAAGLITYRCELPDRLQPLHLRLTIPGILAANAPAPQLQVAPPCRHCGRTPRCRPRGLCWSCYYAPGVRDQYDAGTVRPEFAKFARRGVGLGGRKGRMPSAPTDALPGTEAKVAIMQARAARHEQLFHPGDANLERPALLVA